MQFGFGRRPKPPDPDSPHIAQLLEIIKGLEKGELVEVIWLDACIARERKIGSLKNHDFATYKRTPGYFCALVTDHRYNQYHLILAIEETDGFDESARYDITSIPLAIVMSIKRPSGKQAQAAVKGRRIARVPVKTIRLKWGEVVKLDRHGSKIILEPEER